jgi:Zn-finger protein
LRHLFSLKDVVECYCPHYFLKDWPDIDKKTEKKDMFQKTGCRGITCEQCWNVGADKEAQSYDLGEIDI